MHSATWWKSSAPAAASSEAARASSSPAPGRSSAVECLTGGAVAPAGDAGPAEAAWLRLDNAARTTMPELEAAAARGDEEALARAWSELRLSLAVARTDLADAEASIARAGEEAVVLRTRITAVRSLHDVLEARALQIIDEQATSGPAELSVSEDRLDFPATEVGAESELARLWVRNLGLGPVSIDELRGPAEFPVHGECEGPLGPGEAIEVEVGFRPTEVGWRKATLRIETDGGVRSATVKARGRGVEPIAASLEQARVAGATREARSHDEVAPPRTFTAMRDLLLAARDLAEVGDEAAAFRAALAVHDALRTTCHPARAAEAFSRYGMARMNPEMSLGMAVSGVSALVGKLQLHASINWDFELAQLGVGREAIELLTGERADSASFRAAQRGANVTLGLLGGIPAALAAAPLVAGEAGLLAGGAGMAGRSALLWGASNPSTATALASAATGVAIDMADKGGPIEWARAAATPEGLLGLAFDSLQVYDAHLSSRVATGDVPDETIQCRRGEAAARTGELRRAGAEVTADHVGGDARVIRLRTREGRLLQLVEPGTIGPTTTRPSITGRINALWLQARAAAARPTIARRDAQLAALIDKHRDGEHVLHLFDLAINGGGHAAVLDYATLPNRPPPADTDVTSLPPVMAISAGGNSFADRKVDLGQPPQPLAHDAHTGHQPAELSARSVDYTPAHAFADAVTLTRLESGMPTLRGTVIAISNADADLDRVPGAELRLTVRIPSGETRYVYSKAADIVSGPGPGRQLEDAKLEPAWRARLESDGRLVYEAVGRARKATRVLVSGGGPTGDWNAADIARTGAEVDWVGKPTEPDAAKAPARAAELADIRARLASPDLAPSERDRLARRETDILSFRDAMLDRNLDSQGAMAQPNVHRHGKEIATVTPSEEMTTGDFAGRPGKVHVRFSDDTEAWYDYIVVSHGQDASLPGGPVAVTAGIKMKLGEANGFPLIESADGNIRVLGAASVAGAWKPRLGDDGEKWESLVMKQAKQLSAFSRHIAPSIELAGRQIDAVNRKAIDEEK